MSDRAKVLWMVAAAVAFFAIAVWTTQYVDGLPA